MEIWGEKVGKNRGIKNPYRQSILLSQSYKSTSDPGCRKIVLKQDQMTLVKQDDGLITLRVAKEAVSKSVSRKLRRCLEAGIQKRPESMPLPRPSRLRLPRYTPVSRVRRRCPLSNPTAQTVLNETGIMGQHDVPRKPVFVCNGFAGVYRQLLTRMLLWTACVRRELTPRKPSRVYLMRSRFDR